MDKLNVNESFFVEGSGHAVVRGENGKVGLMHLQDISIDLSSKMEDIFGGEGNFALYTYQTEKGVKITAKNASMSMDLVEVSQGVSAEKVVTLFDTAKITIGTAGEVAVTEATADPASFMVTVDGSVLNVTVADGKATVDKANAGKAAEVFYRYTKSEDAVGASVLTTSVPGYVEFYHVSKPLKQKNGRIVKIYTTIYKARCDGSLKLDFKNKSAFAQELVFNAVDPEREDQKFVSFAVVDVTPKA